MKLLNTGRKCFNMLQFPIGMHKWQVNNIMEMLEEHPEYELMTDEELKKKINELYWKALNLLDKANKLEADVDTIKRYIKIRKE